jgi:plasmid maintenance system antidote protein VapI
MADKSWGDLLRQEIDTSDKTPGWIAGQAGIERSVLARFMGGASINLQTAEKLGRVLGIELTVPKQRRKKS